MVGALGLMVGPLGLMVALRSVEKVHSHSPVVLMENYQMKIANLPNKKINSIEKKIFWEIQTQ